MKPFRGLALLALPCLALIACSAATDDASSSDSNLDEKLDHGQPSNTFPHYAPDHARIVKGDGVVMSAPKLVTITVNDDPNAAKLEQFGDKLGTSRYWRTITSEYGVAPVGGGLHVRDEVTYASGKKSIADSDLETWVVDHVNAAPDNGWPENDGTMFYLVYVPASLAVTSGGNDACSAEEGYHQEFVNTDLKESDPKKHVIFGFVFEKCGKGTFDNTTDTASHELGEGVVDPYIQTANAFTGFDDDHVALDLFQLRQNETGDACEWFDDSNYREGVPVGNPTAQKNADARYPSNESNFAYELQRLWSNQSAAQGHNPCVPLADEPYYNLTPLALEPMSVVVPPKRTKEVATKGYLTKSVRQKDGTTALQAKFSVGFFADRTTKGAWTVTAMEGSPFGPKVLHPRFTKIDVDTTHKDAEGNPSGENGEKAIITITVGPPDKALKFPPTGVLLTLTSKKDGFAPHYLPVLIQVPR